MKIATGISPDYVKGWDAEKAIREIIQNYLDSKKDFGCSGSIVLEKGQAKVKDEGPGLELRHFALGISEKSENAIGKFGEGLKLALLVMAREKRKIEVWSKDKIIIPVIEFDENYQTETMQLIIKGMPHRLIGRFKGTSIKFDCTQEELEAGKNYFTAFQDKARTGFNWVEKGKISLPGGKVYISGAAVGTLPNALFSYHLDDFSARAIGNRDRTSISESDLNPQVQKVISTTRSSNVIDTILKDLRNGGEAWEARLGVNEYLTTNKSRKLWVKSIHKVLGKKVVIGNGSSDDTTQAAYRGYQVFTPSHVWRSSLVFLGMKTVETILKPKKATTKLVQISELTPEEKMNFKTAMDLVEMHYQKPGKVEIAISLNTLAGVAFGEEVNGLWSGSKSKMYLKRGILTNLKNTVHTLLHETVHKVSGKSDCTAEFERALLDVAVGMMKI